MTVFRWWAKRRGRDHLGPGTRQAQDRVPAHLHRRHHRLVRVSGRRQAAGLGAGPCRALVESVPRRLRRGHARRSRWSSRSTPSSSTSTATAGCSAPPCPVNLELVTIGTELLLGFTVDTNSAFAGQALAAAGVRIARRTTVPDEPDAVRDAVAEALARTGVVITTGGLGPHPRRSLQAGRRGPLRASAGVPPGYLGRALTERFARMGRKISERNRCQAEVPRGATVLPNRWGTAPGLWITGARGEVIMLPGVPIEMRGLLTHEVVPRLLARAGGSGGPLPGGAHHRRSGIHPGGPGQRGRRHSRTALAGLPARASKAWTSGSPPGTWTPKRRTAALKSAAAPAPERLGDHAYGTGRGRSGRGPPRDLLAPAGAPSRWRSPAPAA